MDLSILITPAGMEAIQRRIQKLMGERPEVVKAVMVAREFGDLSENAEYKAAREKQRQIDGEIDQLRRRCSHLKVIDIDSIPKDKARFGCVCQTRDTANGEEITFQIVGVDELNFHNREGIQPVSVLSPIGNALLGKKAGELAVVKAPMGERTLEILNIT